MKYLREVSDQNGAKKTFHSLLHCYSLSPKVGTTQVRCHSVPVELEVD